MIAYEAASAFEFAISPMKIDTNLAFMYGLGWGPIAMIIVIQEIYGYMSSNEDRELIRQRRVRGAEIDQEMGIAKKPHWWSRLHGDNRQLDLHGQIARNVSEAAGRQATTRKIESNIEMRNMPEPNMRDSNKPAPDIITLRTAANLLFPAHSMEETQENFTDHPPQVRGRTASNVAIDFTPTARGGVNDRSESNNSTASGLTLGARPQQVRSMLDV